MRMKLSRHQWEAGKPLDKASIIRNYAVVCHKCGVDKRDDRAERFCGGRKERKYNRGSK